MAFIMLTEVAAVAGIVDDGVLIAVKSGVGTHSVGIPLGVFVADVGVGYAAVLSSPPGSRRPFLSLKSLVPDMQRHCCQGSSSPWTPWLPSVPAWRTWPSSRQHLGFLGDGYPTAGDTGTDAGLARSSRAPGISNADYNGDFDVRGAVSMVIWANSSAFIASWHDLHVVRIGKPVRVANLPVASVFQLFRQEFVGDLFYHNLTATGADGNLLHLVHER